MGRIKLHNLCIVSTQVLMNWSDCNSTNLLHQPAQSTSAPSDKPH